MDTNAVAALFAALGGVPIAGPVLPYIPIAVAVAAILAAILPQPAADSPWGPARKLLDLVAMNVGPAKNAGTAPSVKTPPAALGVLIIAAVGLSACSTAQLATAQNVTAVAVADGQLFCAKQTAYGPLVVALADATASAFGASGAISVIGKTSDYVARTCAVIGAIPVVPPANPAAAPVVAVVPPTVS